MSIQLLAHSLAARIPELAKDCAINNAYMIEKEMEACFVELTIKQTTGMFLEIMRREELLFEALKVLAMPKSLDLAAKELDLIARLEKHLEKRLSVSVLIKA